MQQRDPQNPPPLEDGKRDEGAEPLHLHKGEFVALLEKWKTIQLLAALRGSIADFKHEIQTTSHTTSVDDSDDYFVVFSRVHLFNELDQISSALTLERALYYINRLIKGISEVRTSAINDINLNRWQEYTDIQTDSLWLIERRDGSGVHTAGYWGNFVPQIPYQMIKRYTKKGEWVLDTFNGSGTTLIEGQRLGRNTLGIELQRRMVDHAKQLISAEPNTHAVIVDVVEGDSATIDYTALLANYGQKSVQLVIMHPPYFDIIKFSDHARDLSNAASVETFIEMMGAVVDNAAHVLDKGRYLVVVIGDKYAKGNWIPLGFQLMNEVMKRGFALKSLVVKNFEATAGKRTQKELWRYRALVGGFYIFKHEYIFLFKKQ
ncbi:MAG: DNA methyltransferase [Chloroflexales bacterium]